MVSAVNNEVDFSPVNKNGSNLSILTMMNNNNKLIELLKESIAGAKDDGVIKALKAGDKDYQNFLQHLKNNTVPLNEKNQAQLKTQVGELIGLLKIAGLPGSQGLQDKLAMALTKLDEAKQKASSLPSAAGPGSIC